MIFIVRLVIIAVTCFVTSLFFPWWVVILCTVLTSFFITGSNFNAFLSGFLGVGLLWLVMAWKVDIEVNSILSGKIVQLFPLDDSSMLIVVTGFLGGIIGGFSAITGNSFRQIFIKKKKKSFYA